MMQVDGVRDPCSRGVAGGLFLGVHIGVSNVVVGVTKTGVLQKVVSLDFDPNECTNVDSLLGVIDKAFRTLLVNPTNMAAVKAIGICYSGQCKDGVMMGSEIFNDDKDIPIVQLASEMFGLPCILLNDADAAMATEIWNPSTYNIDTDTNNESLNAVMINIGSSIGVSLVLHGEIYEGAHGLVRAGHMIMNKEGRKCVCGQIGCAEAYASATNTAKRMQEVMGTYSENDKDIIADKTSSDLEATVVLREAASGNKKAIKILEEASEYLAILCINICRVIDPSVIMFSGSMAVSDNTLITNIKKYLKRMTWDALPNSVELRVAKSNSDHEDIIGAAFAAERLWQKRQVKLHSLTVPKQSPPSNLMSTIYNEWTHRFEGFGYNDGIRAGIILGLIGACSSLFYVGRIGMQRSVS